MLIAVAGSTGLLGSEFKNYLKNDAIYFDRPDYNISSFNSVEKFFKKNKKIDYLINCAAYTNVPLAEKERSKAYFANGQALGILSGICQKYGTHLIHFSTDFVFNGERVIPYEETDTTDPLNYYGLTKLEGERIIQRNMAESRLFTIFRLQWLYGHSPKTFFNKILNRAGEGLKIVEDEWGSPCSVRFIRETIFNCIEHNEASFKGNLYHLTHDDYCSRFECGKYFLNKLGIKGISAISDLPIGEVHRPKFGVMSNNKLVKDLGFSLGSWREDLDIFIKEMQDV